MARMRWDDESYDARFTDKSRDPLCKTWQQTLDERYGNSATTQSRKISHTHTSPVGHRAMPSTLWPLGGGSCFSVACCSSAANRWRFNHNISQSLRASRRSVFFFDGFSECIAILHSGHGINIQLLVDWSTTFLIAQNTITSRAEKLAASPFRLPLQVQLLFPILACPTALIHTTCISSTRPSSGHIWPAYRKRGYRCYHMNGTSR